MHLKFYLDTRGKGKGDLCPLKLVISHKGKSALYNLNISLQVSQFNAKSERIENHPNKLFLNSFITQRRLDIEKMILQLSVEGRLAKMSATDVKNYVKSAIERDNAGQPSGKTIGEVFGEYIATRQTDRTKVFYTYMHKRISAVSDISSLQFDDITPRHTSDLVAKLRASGGSNNGVIETIVALKTIFNYAIENGITTNFPFRKVKMKKSPTRKRSLTVAQMRMLMDADKSRVEKIAVDLFLVIFGLIGINTVDLGGLTAIDAFGRVEYDRAKTGRHYSVKVEPEVAALIDKYKGEDKLLRFFDGGKNYNYVRNKINYGLKTLCRKIGLPVITTYWARHTWATLAASLDIPRDVIAHALGHGNNTVTDIYIDFDERKVDDANRRVLDLVFGGR